MLYILGLSIAANLSLALVVFGYLRVRDDREAKERQELYQRIQAPEIAVATAIPETPGELGFVPVDDDEAHWANRTEQLSGN